MVPSVPLSFSAFQLWEEDARFGPLAGLIRFAISAGLGWLVAAKFHSDLDVLFKFIAAGTVAACVFCCGAAVMNLIWKINSLRNFDEPAGNSVTSIVASNQFAD